MDKDARATQLLSTFHRTELYLISFNDSLPYTDIHFKKSKINMAG